MREDIVKIRGFKIPNNLIDDKLIAELMAIRGVDRDVIDYWFTYNVASAGQAANILGCSPSQISTLATPDARGGRYYHKRLNLGKVWLQLDGTKLSEDKGTRIVKFDGLFFKTLRERLERQRSRL